MTTKTPRVPKPIDPVAVAEKMLKDCVGLYLYAAIADLTAETNEDPRFPVGAYQNYANLRRLKDEKIKKLKNICVIAPEIPQNLLALFNTIKLEAQDAQGESYDQFIGSTQEGSVLRLLSNPIIMGHIRSFETNLSGAPDQYALLLTHVLDTIADRFRAMHVVTAIMNFMKTICWKMACDIWYAKTTMNHAKFISTCATLFMGQKAQGTIDELIEGVRPRVKVIKAIVGIVPLVEPSKEGPIVIEPPVNLDGIVTL